MLLEISLPLFIKLVFWVLFWVGGCWVWVGFVCSSEFPLIQNPDLKQNKTTPTHKTQTTKIPQIYFACVSWAYDQERQAKIVDTLGNHLVVCLFK